MCKLWNIFITPPAVVLVFICVCSCVSVYLCMYVLSACKHPVSHCDPPPPMLSAWLCPIKQRQRVQIPLRRTTMTWRRMRSRRQCRGPQSTTSVWKKRKWKRWWTGANVLPTRSLPDILFLSLSSGFSEAFSSFFFYSLPPSFPNLLRPSGGRWMLSLLPSSLLFGCAWSAERHGTQRQFVCHAALLTAVFCRTFESCVLKRVCLLWEIQCAACLTVRSKYTASQKFGCVGKKKKSMLI